MPRPALYVGCSVDGCTGDHVARSYCSVHYWQWRVRTDPPPLVRILTCTVDGCDRPTQSRGMCHAHYGRWHRTGSTAGVHGGPIGVRRYERPFDDVPRYTAAHRRLVKTRGKAAGHVCDECGKPALDWAYDHADACELVEAGGRHTGKVYSADPAHYRPLCRSCHIVEEPRNLHPFQRPAKAGC